VPVTTVTTPDPRQKQDIGLAGIGKSDT